VLNNPDLLLRIYPIRIAHFSASDFIEMATGNWEGEVSDPDAIGHKDRLIAAGGSGEDSP